MSRRVVSGSCSICGSSSSPDWPVMAPGGLDVEDGIFFRRACVPCAEDLDVEARRVAYKRLGLSALTASSAQRRQVGELAERLVMGGEVETACELLGDDLDGLSVLEGFGGISEVV